MQSSISVLKEAPDISLVSLKNAKLALNLTTDTTQTLDDQIELLIKWSSGQIAVQCNRVLAQETLQETFLEVDENSSRLYLSRWPVRDIETITVDGTELAASDYDLDADFGVLTRLNGEMWTTTPVVVTYTAGYELPREAPEAMQQAALLLTREAYNQMLRGDASIRMVAHKEARIIYFDPNARAGAAGTTGNVGSATQRAVTDLLSRFMRIQV